MFIVHGSFIADPTAGSDVGDAMMWRSEIIA
jgi:hypothetical protein